MFLVPKLKNRSPCNFMAMESALSLSQSLLSIASHLAKEINMISPQKIIKPSINSSHITKIMVAALLPLTGLASQSALAQTTTSSIKVVYADINLTSDLGKEKLSNRINAAIKKVCIVNDTRSLAERQNMQKCKVKAMQNAERQLNIILASHNNAAVKVTNSRIFIVGN